MSITHHPGFESLMSCSAGSQPEAFAAVMASHIEMCPACRKDLALMEQIGVSLLETLAPSPVVRPAPVNVVRASEAVDAEHEQSPKQSGEVPKALQGVAGMSLDTVPWKRISPGVWQYQIPLNHGDRGELRLIKVGPGQSLPEHGHQGSEITLVLRGSYTDVTGRYAAGDVSDLGDDVEHAPVADPVEGCICLVATENRLKFRSRVARLIQPFIGI